LITLNAESNSSELERIRRVRNQRVLSWVHTVLALITAAFYLNQINLGRFEYWHLGGSFEVLLVIIPVVLPYLISVVYSRRVVTGASKRVALFSLLLTLGFALMVCLLTGIFGDVGWGFVLEFIIFQSFVYVWGAELLLHVV
jgi:hypothetical protein